MMERRLSDIDGGCCTISNLKAKVCQLEKALKEAVARLPKSISDHGWVHPSGGANETVTSRWWGDPVDHGKEAAGGTVGQEGSAEQGQHDDGKVSDAQGAQEAADEEEVPLQGEELRCFQTQAARANYLCLDRPDIGFATKECMRRMSSPTQGDLIALKKLGRYLMGAPRVVSTFYHGESSEEVIVEGETPTTLGA